MGQKLLTLIASCTLMFACGKEDKKSGREEAPLPIYEGPSFSLLGVNNTTWTGECIKSKNYENRSYQVVVAFKEPRLEISSVNFDGVTCDPNLRLLSFTERYYSVKNDEMQRLAGWTTIAYYVEAIEIVLHSESYVLGYNAAQRYGYNSWAANVPVDISGRRFSEDSEPEHEKNTVRERTYRVIEDKLYFASYANGAPEASTDFPYTLNN